MKTKCCPISMFYDAPPPPKEWKRENKWKSASRVPFRTYVLAEPNMHIVRYYNAWIEVILYYVKKHVSHLNVYDETPPKRVEKSEPIDIAVPRPLF